MASISQTIPERHAEEIETNSEHTSVGRPTKMDIHQLWHLEDVETVVKSQDKDKPSFFFLSLNGPVIEWINKIV